jgi:predicted glycosyltransferase
LDGLNLIWNSDLVVSGGGTMNREAAALGVPVYSIFRGNVGAVDQHLSEKGRLVLIQSVADVSAKIHLVRRQRRPVADVASRSTLHFIVDTIEEIVEKRACGM